MIELSAGQPGLSPAERLGLAIKRREEVRQAAKNARRASFVAACLTSNTLHGGQPDHVSSESAFERSLGVVEHGPNSVDPAALGQKAEVDPLARVLKVLNLAALEHLLLCVPTGYVDCRNPITTLEGLSDQFRGLFLLRKTGLVEVQDAQKNAISCEPFATIYDAPYKGYWDRVKHVRFELCDLNGTTVWMNSFSGARFRGKESKGEILVDATIQTFGRRRYLSPATELSGNLAGKVWARYTSPGAPSEAVIRDLIRRAQESPGSYAVAASHMVEQTGMTEESLLGEAEYASGQRYASLVEFLQALHAPLSPWDGELVVSAARAMAVAGISTMSRKASTRTPMAEAAIPISNEAIQNLIASQPETLTEDQISAIQGIVHALRQERPLNGLLSGNVGTGKTLTYLIPMVAAHQIGAKVAVVSPTELLANQVFATIRRRFPYVRVERVMAGGRIKDVGAILVGTSGLSSVARRCKVNFNLAVVDEQHKLSAKDRLSLVSPATHLLEASATPIPRSLAATLYCGMAVFNLHKAPVERHVESYLLEESERAQASRWMRATLAGGARVAVIYPRVESTSSGSAISTSVQSVSEAAEGLEKHFPGQVSILHGKLPADGLEQAMFDFAKGTKAIAVASTVFETGIDVENIRLMIVKGADRFGIAQLHQLRGRLAREGGHARFVMMVAEYNNLAAETSERLNKVCAISDGFELAEADMATRGFGDLAGEQQTGNGGSAFRLLRLNLKDFAQGRGG